jgi:uncharacterized protein (DUF1800 family)
MTPFHSKKLIFSVLAATGLLLAAFRQSPTGSGNFHMPYAEAGLTKEQAASHLLDRFAFGASREDMAKVEKIGPEQWFLQQLEGRLPEPELGEKLSGLDAINLSNEQALAQFPRPARLYQEAMQAGYLKKEDASLDKKSPETRQAIRRYMQSKGYRPQQELFRQFISQKILRAAYSENPLHEVLTDFWFNHFNVSLTKNECAPYIPAYERDVIRPNVTGKFENLLLATAQSPAMLFYLDNFSSMGDNEEMRAQRALMEKRMERKLADADPNSTLAQQLEKRKERQLNQGLNENYAREIMELHTLGVDGGYTQSDVTEAARVLTGWTIFPANEEGPGRYVRKMIDQVGEDRLVSRGFVHKGDFLFAMSRHDTKPKTVLGRNFAGGGGYEEGLELIRMLSNHPSTARFVCRKLAVRFVNDDPAPALVDRMAQVFLNTKGDIGEVLKAMVASPEFWSKDALREKTKSPFELAISAVRVLHAEVDAPYMLNNYITKMGQKMYYYQAPTGFPDKGSYWINAGSLLNRMNFGMDLAAQRIPGLKVDLAALNDDHEPESAEAALRIYSRILLPSRDLEPTLKRLVPMINDPSIQKKIGEAATAATPKENITNGDEMMEGADDVASGLPRKLVRKEQGMKLLPGDDGMTAQVVGIILGSPEFQRK